MARRLLPWVFALAAASHAMGMARSTLPAQDGLKFIRVARQFHSRPWADVVRETDRHPLYPALIALAQPAVGATAGDGADSWRLAAQVVSSLAALALLVPLYWLARVLFDGTTATLASLIYALLPLPAAVGHDTLADAVALLAFAASFAIGVRSLRSTSFAAPAACGLAAGLGYLARPEVAAVPIAVLIAAATAPIGRRLRLATPDDRSPSEASEASAGWVRRHGPGRWAALGVAFLAMVGSYAIIKGEVSEKLSVRGAASLPASATPRKVKQALPRGLDDPRWDFSAKEESERSPTRGTGEALARLVERWSEAMGWAFAAFALWGALRARSADGSGPAKRLVVVYLAIFAAILVRHATTLGYLSGRHTLTMVVLSVPWAAAGLLVVGRRLARICGWNPALSRALGGAVLLALIVVGVGLQTKESHRSRWGHSAAGRWLAAHAAAADAVLDTRGWASFVSGRPAYDYWHVRQALTDSRLAFVVVGADELSAPSRRAETLRAVLAYAGEPVADFPGERGGGGVAVRVFRFRRPASWEGLRP